MAEHTLEIKNFIQYKGNPHGSFNNNDNKLSLDEKRKCDKQKSSYI